MSLSPLQSLYLLILILALLLAGFILLRRWQSRRLLVARLAELSVFADIGRAILGTPLDLHQLARVVYEQAGKIVDTSIFQLGLFEADRYRLLIWIVDGQPRPLAEFALTDEAEGIVGWVRRTRQNLLVGDFAAERDRLPARPRYVSADPPRSAVFVPLLLGEQVLGVIAIQSRHPHAFTEEHLRLLPLVANHAAAALEQGRLLEQAQRKAAQLQALADISQRLNAFQSLPALYHQVVQLTAERFADREVSLFVADEQVLLLGATTRADWQAAPPVVALGAGLVGQAAQTRAAAVAEYPERLAETGLESGPRGQAELALPVEGNERLLGVLHVRGAGRTFEPDELSIFRSLAAQLAVAILEGRSYEAERQRADHLAAIAQISRAIASTLELDDLLDEVLDLVDEHFNFRPAHIFFAQEQQLIFHAGTGRSAQRWAVEGLVLDLDGPSLPAQAGRTRRPVSVTDVAAHPGHDFTPLLPDARAEMAVPLVMGDHLLGVFEVQSEQPGAFGDDDLQNLQTVADTLAVAMRNARLFEAERRRRRLAEILREVSGALTSTLQLEVVLNHILDGLARVVSYDAASVLLVNDLGEVQLRAARGVPDMEEVLGQVLDVKLFPAGSRLPAAVPFGEVDHLGEYHDLLALPDPHACLGAVLALQSEHLGYLVVDRGGDDTFPAEEVEVITAFASQAAVAIENARLYTAQRDQAWVSMALLQVADATARATDLQAVFDTVAYLTPMLVGVERCAVLQLEEDQFVLQAYHAADLETPPDTIGQCYAPDTWPRLAEMMDTRQPVVIGPEDEMPAHCRALFSGLVILLPLLAKGQVQGALLVGQTPGNATFTTERIQLLGGIASQAALAIESSLLSHSQQEEAWVSTALLQVAQAVAGQPTLEDGLEMVARLTPLLVGLERVAIFKWDETNRLFVAGQVIGTEAVELAAFTARPTELGLDVTASQAEAYACVLPERLAGAFGAELVLVWPLWARGDLMGALVVEQAGVLGRRVSILNGIANQLSMAMESARLARDAAQQQRLERELEVGRDIQASFLPKSCPEVPGWEVSAFWRAARQVGGDFYDFIPLRADAGSERWGIVIADVADKGVPAALFMALSRTLLRSAAIGRISPAATLERVNRLILADARSDLFVTVFYGVWEPASGRLRFASGGHNPPSLVRADGQVHSLRARGMALGVLEGVEYEEHEITLAPEDVLLLYTDGVTDAIDVAEIEFGLQRMNEVVAHMRGAPAEEIVQAVTQAIDRHTGSVPAFDDMTMVAIKHLR